ncbi:tail protein X [Metapseudomonas otitidis]|uniref:tail protein X n=1 Tax=Metapseudomonas otitidis TaxID=319939 RepID=UPI001F44916D|nr:tail protein X [Pseudomonas otitidis]
MATTIKTSDGDVLDRLLHQYYGHVMGTVEAVLEANPGLAVRAQPFVSSVVTQLPDLAPARTDVINLWD